MPVTPTYPGVYIEELPSAVRTIVGVATSITAFVGFTKRGLTDRPVDVFNFADFEREFGGLDGDSPLSHAVQQFFLNGGGQAVIVRVAHDTATASVELKNGTEDAPIVLKLIARNPGTWADALRITVDYDATNPDSLFNLRVTEQTPGGSKTQTHSNLTMNSQAARYAVDIIKAESSLLDAERGSGLGDPSAGAPAGGYVAGKSVTGKLVEPIDVPSTTTLNSASLMLSQNGDPPGAVEIESKTYTLSGLASALDTATGTDVAVAVVDDRIVFTDARELTERSSIHITSGGPAADLAAAIKAGVDHDGREFDGIAAFRPASTGTTGEELDESLPAGGLSALTGPASVSVEITTAAGSGTASPVEVLKATDGPLQGPADLRDRLEVAIQGAATNQPTIATELAGTTVAVIDDGRRLVVTAGGGADAAITIKDVDQDTTASSIGLASAVPNVAAYSPLIGAVRGQASASLGNDGGPPNADELIGSFGAKSGMYALRDADLFNLLVLPDADGTNDAVLSAAMSFCEDRRAFLITDLPESVDTLGKAQDWIKHAKTPKSPNAAAYFPRPLIPDPLKEYIPRRMVGAGAIAGLYARTDASRGIWKAPAGTDAALRGPTSFAVQLTDMENGMINPLGLNANRAFPVYGHVVWGARTLVGSDKAASQWKYVPIRRLALFIEETLYRGTKWVVFEPNDEPLWAQIRLSIGTFMHGLFRQGAFQGASPRQAYLVKCDSETTIQADIDQGIVNIIVGFAPLKPAEFVIIKITQLAGQLEV